MVLDFSHSVNGNTRSASSPQLSIESKYFVKNASNLVTRSGGLSFDSIPMCRVKFLIQDKKDMLLFLQTKETQVLSPMFQMENSRIVMKQVQE